MESNYQDTGVKTPDPVLVIWVRRDMESLTPGKAMAQVSHATCDLWDMAEKQELRENELKLFKIWRNQTKQGFGTTLIYSFIGYRCDIRELENDLDGLGSCIYITNDPTYPVEDGRVTHRIPVDTCAWTLVDRNRGDVKQINEKYTLYS